MTPVEGVDLLGASPTPAELLAAGKRFRLGYLDRPDSSLTRAQVDALHAAGIDVGLIAEWGAQRMLGGAQAGAVDGQRAAAALKALGAPGDTVVYFAADWNASASQMAAIDAYLTGAASAIGLSRTGVYGGLAVVRHVLQSRTATRLWQTYAWSGTPTVWAAGTHLQQYANGQSVGGHAVDYTRAMVADWGQWRAQPAAPAQPAAHTLHVAAGATVYIATVSASGCIAGWTTRKWGATPSSAPCGPEQRKPGCVSGGAQVVHVPRGAFAGKWVRASSPGVTVTQS